MFEAEKVIKLFHGTLFQVQNEGLCALSQIWLKNKR
ncbi:hypothetical protein NC651_013525 [Populus alba x Populus x berolinensis]|nr:hypothetical protein NC651_013525 [Populus alba x Populus x berolinensis]